MMNGLKFNLVLMFLIHYLLVAGQMGEQVNPLESLWQADDRLSMVLTRMSIDQLENKRKWCYLRRPEKKLFGIKHQPLEDFNIYFTFTQKVTPSIKAAMEVSLNYSGVVNLKSMIALRRKTQ